MKRFDIRNVHAWQTFDKDAALPVEVYSEYREALIRVMASHPVRVYVQVEDHARILIAVGEGILEAAITIASEGVVTWESDVPDAEVFLLPMVGSQLWEDEDGDGSFTVVEPRASTESDQYRRMMMLMNQNVQARINAQLAAMKEADGQVIEELKAQLDETNKKLADLKPVEAGE